MKNKIRYILIAFFFLATKSLMAQKKTTYQLKYGISIDSAQVNGTLLGSSKVIAQQGYFVKIDKVLGNDYLIYFLPWNKQSKVKSDISLVDANNYIDGLNQKFVYTKDNNQKYFLISKCDFKTATSKVESNYDRAFIFGAVTVPIKLRFASKNQDSTNTNRRYFNFEGDVNLGISAGMKFFKKDNEKKWLGFLVGASITSVPVGPETTNGEQEAANVAAFTPSLGIIYQYNDFQLGVFSGMDLMGGEELSKSWVYQGIPWLGIGMGISIFKNEIKPKSPTAQKRIF